MKILNNIINKVGIDTCLHFLGGISISALISLICLLQIGYTSWGILIAPLLSALSVAVLSVGKEIIFDDEFSKKDVIVSVIGTIPTFLAVVLGILFHFISN